MPSPPVSWNSKGDTLTATTAGTSSASAAIVANATATSGDARGLESFAVNGHAVHAEASGSNAFGVYGLCGHTVGAGIGVYGRSDGAGGSGVYGRQTGSLGFGVRAYQTGSKGVGVYATQTGSAGRGVYGYASNTLSTPTLWAAGVYGKARSTYSVGVYGTNSATEGVAIRGEATGDRCIGLSGIATSSNFPTSIRGVEGMATATAGHSVGVYGEAWGDGNTQAMAYGVHGVVRSTRYYGVVCSGDFAATGHKNFIQPHPTDASKSVQFVCLEGNESGTYFRGKAQLVNGRAEIAIPEEWQLGTETEGITVQVTSLGRVALLGATEVSRDRIVVEGPVDCEFFYFVNGVRRGFAKYEPYVPNTAFRPDVKGVPFGTQYPKALRDILVKNGVLNPDYTPNEATAARLGWKLRKPSEIPVAQRWWLRSEEWQRLRKATPRGPSIDGRETASRTRVEEGK